MIVIKTPQHYDGGVESINHLGTYARSLGRNALVIGGKTALSVIGETLYASLDESGVSYHIEEFAGYPTYATAEGLAEKARDLEAAVLIGVGGGKALDTVKTVGHQTGIPVIAVPTIAATCAAWAACIILYDEDGGFADALFPDVTPQAVFVDYTVLAEAPLRYLKAGIADTLAKWYESVPNLEYHDSLLLRLQIKQAEVALEIIREKGPRTVHALQSSAHGQLGAVGRSQDFTELVDAVILLAGLVGSIASPTFYGGFAHPFYNSITQIPETRDKLHGEKVSFGLVAQALLEKQDDDYLAELLFYLKFLDQPLTLEELGITDEVSERVARIAKDTVGFLGNYQVGGKPVTEEQAIAAIFETDKLGTQLRQQSYGEATERQVTAHIPATSAIEKDGVLS